MTQKTAQTIKLGAHVVHTHDRVRGTIVRVDYASFRVRWDDGIEQKIWKNQTGVIEVEEAVAA